MNRQKMTGGKHWEKHEDIEQRKKKQLQRSGKHFVVQNRDEIVLENASPPEPAMHIELGPTWARTCCQGSTLRSDSSSNERMTEGQISHK